MFLLDWCYNGKPSTQIEHRCLSQTGQSTTWWWKKCCWYGYISMSVGSISPSDFDGQLSEVLVISCLYHTLLVNGSVLFYFLLCARYWLCFCGSINNLKGASHLLTDMLFIHLCPNVGWMDVIPFLKGNYLY